MRLHELFLDGHFSPPATEAEIATIENQLGACLPEQLRRLYFECNGFRENRGNSQYLFSLTNEDDPGGSLLGMTRFMWNEFPLINLHSFIFFGSSGGDEIWGINHQKPNEIIAYHFHMGDQYEFVGTEIGQVYRADYATYDDVEENA